MSVNHDIKAVRLDRLLRHIDNVRENGIFLVDRLKERNKPKDDELAHLLLANVYIHDNSKFFGIEFAALHEDIKHSNPELFEAAASQHVTTNPHHPEYYIGGITEMPIVYVAEMVVDWKSRSGEFGGDMRQWIKEVATSKYKFTVNSGIYKQIKVFTDLLLEPKFT